MTGGTLAITKRIMRVAFPSEGPPFLLADDSQIGVG